MHSSIESLESRIAPAVLTGNVLTYTDIDGDHVSITFSKGTLAEANFTFDVTNAFSAGNAMTPMQLRVADIHTDAGVSGTDITMKVTKAGNGDGLAAIGKIDATGVNIGKVKLVGDLGAIEAGDDSATGIAIAALSVVSMGRYDLLTQGGAGTLESDVKGALGSLAVKGSIERAFLYVHNGGGTAKIGAVTMGGSLIGGASPGNPGLIFSDTAISSVKIGGSILGGTGALCGAIKCGGDLGPVKVGGSLVGGAGNASGSIFADGTMSAVVIGHDVLGGAGSESGYVEGTGGKIASVSIGGSLTGGTGSESGCLVASTGTVRGNIGRITIGHDIKGGSGMISGFAVATGTLGNVTVGGSVIGGANSQSGGIQSDGDLGAVKIGHDLIGTASSFTGFVRSGGMLAGVTIGGSLIGGPASDSGEITTFAAIGLEHNMGPIKIGHDLIGGSIDGTMGDISRSGCVVSGGMISSFWAGGSIVTGVDNSTGGGLFFNGTVRAEYNIPSFTVGGSVIGNHNVNGDSWAIISARGLDMPLPTSDPALGKLTIGGNLQWGLALGGYDVNLTPADGKAQIGAVKIKGDWVASSIVAGVQNPHNSSTDFTHFGDGADTLITPNPNISKIASITVGGYVVGDYLNVGYHFAMEGNNLFPVKYGGATAPNFPGVTSIGGITSVVIYRF